MAPTSGGIKLSLEGQHFAARAKVHIAGIEAKVVSAMSDTLITATVPARPGTFGQPLALAASLAKTNN